MEEPGPHRVLLFLAGDTSLSERRGSLPPGVSGFGRIVIPPLLAFMSPHRPAGTPENDEHKYPLDQVEVAQTVLDGAGPLGVQVEIVDVNLRGLDRAIVDRYVGPDDVLPVLARADGQRLVGSEEFTPGAVRGFLRRA